MRQGKQGDRRGPWLASAVAAALVALACELLKEGLLPELSGLGPVAAKLEEISNIAVVRLAERDIVRHPLVASMLGVL